MFCKSSFTVFLLSLRIGKQGMPLFFRCFLGNNSPEAFSLSLIKEGISYVHNLFIHKDCKLIFLADRWFNFRQIMEHINSLGDTYCIRTKTNIRIPKFAILLLLLPYLHLLVLLYFGLLLLVAFILIAKLLYQIT